LKKEKIAPVCFLKV